MLVRHFFQYLHQELAIRPCLTRPFPDLYLCHSNPSIFVIDSYAAYSSLLHNPLVSARSVIVFTDGQLLDDVELGDLECLTPFLFVSQLSRSAFEYRLQQYLVNCRTITGLGTVVNIDGLGVLIEGAPGVGKSDLALGLIDRGHRLIVDDAAQWRCSDDGQIQAHCPDGFHGLLAIRGVGIIDIPRIYQDSSLFLASSALDLVVHLSERSTISKFDVADTVLGTCALQDAILPWVSLPMIDARDMPLLLELLVRQHQLRLEGYDAEIGMANRLATQLC